MDSAAEYIARIHEGLITHLDEDPTGLCVLFATQVAERLTAEGKPFDFVRFQEMIRKGEYDYNRKPIKPKLYGGRVLMGGHTICCEDDLAYDPLVGRPIPLEGYCIEVFGEEIRQKVLSEEEMIDLIRQGKRMSVSDSLSLFSFDCT